jgi:hypothetical protein
VRGLRERWAGARTGEDFAWACLVANLFGIPGMGTVMAQRWEGVPQLALAIVGGILLTWWLVAFALAFLRTMTIPAPGGPDLRLGLWGVGLFGVAWVWALASSVAVLRVAKGEARGGARPAR